MQALAFHQQQWRRCALPLLGGNKYRDGSFEYYIGERVRDNDGKGSGIYFMGCWELGESMK